MADKKLGFFNTNENLSKSNDETPVPRKGYSKEYQPPLVPRSPDTENTSVTPARVDESVKSDTVINKRIERKTMRVPEDQFFEFMALLDTSEYSYVYELLGDMIDQRLNTLNTSELRIYQSALDSIKRTEEKKKNRRKK
ncbi:hypothetical protein KQX72_14630 (plasmid) [Listeria monocytogenes]|uniref:hypothetical protein n=1 Tax=Listeria monocytogenes TaxID=1639 RepID=UPI000874829F|nr:hypothetical protein [Listeria monocytogenes]EAD9920959.1 hypothetical protein [Listeria monocytogenes]EAD9923854.1 hypothetical protein [Listeria monocytogenes]EAE7321122.1 hypothetical protein [Listeria monocytogenes]EAF1164261.1 hypothetical protein [Listeria monocytogenes]EAG3451468.1 hypothetical protein [Listeria monocytogenes]